MVTEWPVSTVAQLQNEGVLLVEDGNHGEYRPRPEEFGNGAVAFIRAADMAGGVVLFDAADRINESALRRLRKGIGRGGDILFSHKGTVGKLALTALDAPPFVCSPQTTFWRVLDETRLDRHFLYYFMRSRAFQEQWQARKGETDMADYVSLSAQRQLAVAVPPICVQRTIGGVLGALDEKIHVNRRINQTLVASATALFKAWFVDFEPVTAKVAGRKPAGLAGDVAAWFPDKFVDSELGPVPASWKAGRFSELVKIHGGGTPRTSVPGYWGGEIPWFSVVDTPAAGEVFVLDTEKRITERGLRESAAKLLETGTTIVTARGTVGNLALVGTPMAMNQSCYGLSGRPGYGPFFVYYSTAELVEELRQRTHGSVFDTITRSTFDSVRIPIPPSGIASGFDRQVGPLLERIKANVQECRTLAALRDTLLPKLFSGEVRLRGADRMLEWAGA